MLIKKMFYLFLGIVLSISWLGSVVFAVDKYHQPPHTIADLDKLCQKHVGKDGTAEVTVGAANFQNQSGRISVPCTIYVKPGSTFQMTNIDLESKGFAVGSIDSDKPERNQPIHIILRRVKLIGAQDNFQIDTAEPGSTIAVQDSTIDYPNLVGISAGTMDDDGRSSVEVANTTIRSMKPNNDGIWLVTTGQLVAKNNHFYLNDPEDVAGLLGGKCTVEANIGAGEHCQGP